MTKKLSEPDKTTKSRETTIFSSINQYKKSFTWIKEGLANISKNFRIKKI